MSSMLFCAACVLVAGKEESKDFGKNEPRLRVRRPWAAFERAEPVVRWKHGDTKIEVYQAENVAGSTAVTFVEPEGHTAAFSPHCTRVLRRSTWPLGQVFDDDDALRKRTVADIDDVHAQCDKRAKAGWANLDVERWVVTRDGSGKVHEVVIFLRIKKD